MTGAAGQIAYSLLFGIAKGDVFGKDQVKKGLLSCSHNTLSSSISLGSVRAASIDIYRIQASCISHVCHRFSRSNLGVTLNMAAVGNLISLHLPVHVHGDEPGLPFKSMKRILCQES